MKNTILACAMLLLGTNSFCQDPLYTTDSPLPCIHKSFQLYVYIVRDSLGRPILSRDTLQHHIDRLNEAFAPICISFEVCHQTFIDDYSYLKINDIDEVGLLTSRFQKKRRINLYITSSVLASQINSYSDWNGIQNEDGATIIAPSSGRGLIHEMGHTFGLYHIFETKLGRETVDGKNCRTAGDKICDTPAAPDSSPASDCSFFSLRSDDNGQYYQAEVGNYMSHHFCAHCFFTKEQYLKMAASYLESTFKMW